MPAAAHAVDVTFQVPVDVSGFPPDVISVTVECWLLPVEPMNARGTASVTLKSGAFKGTVSVPLTVTSAQIIEGAPKITSYSCELYSATANIWTQKNLAVSLTGGSYSGPFRAPPDPKAPAPADATGSIKLQPKP